jgi:hypothetical protein
MKAQRKYKITDAHIKFMNMGKEERHLGRSKS